MYGISVHAAGVAVPARGLTQIVIIDAVHSGQRFGCEGS